MPSTHVELFSQSLSSQSSMLISHFSPSKPSGHAHLHNNKRVKHFLTHTHTHAQVHKQPHTITLKLNPPTLEQTDTQTHTQSHTRVHKQPHTQHAQSARHSHTPTHTHTACHWTH